MAVRGGGGGPLEPERRRGAGEGGIEDTRGRGGRPVVRCVEELCDGYEEGRDVGVGGGRGRGDRKQVRVQLEEGRQGRRGLRWGEGVKCDRWQA
jgi:hypothetical protein